MNRYIIFKQITLAFTFILSTISVGYAQCCTYTLDMVDSFGDGWNGATVDIVINGSTLAGFTIPSGSTATESITICDGDNIELIFNSGTWDTEISYTFSSPSMLLVSDGPSPIIGSVYTGTGDCTISTCDAGPTSNVDSNLESFFLLGNTSQISYSGCPGVLGVEDQTTQSADLSAGGNYSADLQFGTCGGNFAGAGEAWVDWNQDGVYVPSESIGTWQGTPPSALTSFNFLVPGNALSGTTTMRVMQQENGTNPLDPCASFSWGSVVEFSILITGGIDCTGLDGDNSITAILVPSIPYVDTSSTLMCYSSQSAVYSSPDVFYKFGVNQLAATTTVSLCNSSFDTYLTILDQNLDVVAFNDDGVSCISGESEITFASGSYDTLYAVVEGWNIESGEYIINITEELNVGIAEGVTTDINMYPNPAKDILYFSGNFISQIDIVDLQGRKVSSIENEFGISKVNISELIPGSYLVRMKGGQQNWQAKQLIILNHE